MAIPQIQWTGEYTAAGSNPQRPPIPLEFEGYWRFATQTTLNHLPRAWLDVEQAHWSNPRGARVIVSGHGMPHGEGHLRSDAGGIVYAGKMNTGWKHGTGIGAIWEAVPAGGVGYVGEYAGEWRFGARHGFGELICPDGSKYEGQWAYDALHGLAMSTDILGATYIGAYSRGVRHGCGTFKYPSGAIEEREYHYGRLVRARDSLVESPERAKLAQLRANAAMPPASAAAPGSSRLQELTGVPQSGTADELPAKGAISLAGKRLLKKAQEETLVAARAQLKLILPGTTLDVDWDSFTKSAHGNIAVWTLVNYNGLWTLAAVVKTLETMCKDADTKQILSAVKKITLANDDKASEIGARLTGGVLVLTNAFSAGEDSKINTSQLQKKIESAV